MTGLVVMILSTFGQSTVVADSLWIDDSHQSVRGHQSDYTHPYFEYYGMVPKEELIQASEGEGTADISLDY